MHQRSFANFFALKRHLSFLSEQLRLHIFLSWLNLILYVEFELIFDLVQLLLRQLLILHIPKAFNATDVVVFHITIKHLHCVITL